MGLQRGAERLPELVVDVLDGVDPEAVDVVVGHHVLEDADQPVLYLGLLGPEVVEPEEVAIEAVLAGERAVAPVVVVGRVVEERRGLDRLVLDRVVGRRVREADRRVDAREGAGAGEGAVVERCAEAVDVRRVGLRDVRRVVTLFVGDHVAGVVGDDVEEDVDPECVGIGNELLHLGVGTEVRVDRGVVDLPVAVVAGARAAGGALSLDPAVGELRGQPDRGDAEAVEVGQLGTQTGQVAAVIEALRCRVEAVDEPVGRRVAGCVVARVTVVESVRHHEVEDVVLRVDAHRRPDKELVAWLSRAAARVDADIVRRRVVAEGDGVAVDRGESDVPGGVALRPALAEGDLELVRAGGELVGCELVDAVAVGILEPRAKAVGLPVAGAAELGLERARRGGDRRVHLVGDPVGLVVPVELDVAAGRREDDVRPVELGVGAVVLVPGVIDSGLVLVGAGRDCERALPDVVVGVVREVGRCTVGLPVAGAAELVLQAAGDRDTRWPDGSGRGDGDRHVVGCRVEGDGDGVAACRRERNVGGRMALVPLLVESDLELVAAGRDGVGRELVRAIAVGVLQPRAKAVGLPVARAAEFGLEAPGRRGDGRVDVVGDPMGGVVVVEPDIGRAGEAEWDVGAVGFGIGAVVLVPGVVERRLVLPVAGRHRERAPPHAIAGTEVGRGAVGLPVAGATELALQRPGDRYRGRRRCVIGDDDRSRQRH